MIFSNRGTLQEQLARAKARQRNWLEVSNQQFEQMQVGKSYRVDGRVGRVVSKSTDSPKTSAGWSSIKPMVEIEWKAARS